jgi:hypothetical protein
MSGSLNGSSFSFSRKSDRLHEFVALDGSNYASPIAVGRVDNQKSIRRSAHPNVSLANSGPVASVA